MTKIIEDSRNARGRRTYAALLRAARELIEQDGFAALTMASVAGRAGVSRRAVYLHYAGRTELLAALYWHLGEAEDLAASLQAVWDSADAVSALTEWAEHIARSHPRILGVIQAIERAKHDDPDAAELSRTAQGNWLKGSRRLMRWLSDEDRLAPQWTVDTAADMMWALMSIDLLDRLVNQRRWSSRRVAAHLTTPSHTTFVGSPARTPPESHSRTIPARRPPPSDTRLRQRHARLNPDAARSSSREECVVVGSVFIVPSASGSDSGSSPPAAW